MNISTEVTTQPLRIRHSIQGRMNISTEVTTQPLRIRHEAYFPTADFTTVSR